MPPTTVFGALFSPAPCYWEVYSNNMRVVTVKRESLARVIADELISAGYMQVFVRGV